MYGFDLSSVELFDPVMQPSTALFYVSPNGETVWLDALHT